MPTGTRTSALPARFFIAGCQRSGTTLMRLVLECHPDVFCFDETRGYQVLAREAADGPAGKTVGFKVPRWTEQLAEAVLADEGLAERAARFYAGEPVVFMVRDARDTAASMMKLDAGSGSWLDVYGRSILEAKTRQPAFARRYAREIGLLREAGDSRASVAALYWKYKTAAYFDYKARGWPVLGVGYEALVARPEPWLRAVVGFLGLAWHPALLDHPAVPHAEVEPCGFTVGRTDPKRAIDGGSVGRWREVLTPVQVGQIDAVAGDLMERVAAELERLSPAA